MPSTYHIELRGFPGITRDEAVILLANRFDLAIEKANRLVNSAPCVVRSGVTAKAAKSYAIELLAIGADVRIVDDVTGSGQAYRAIDLEALEGVGGGRNGSTKPSLKIADDEMDPFVRGVQRSGATLYCPSCGYQQSSAERCSNCGHWVSAEFPSVTTGNSEVAEDGDSAEDPSDYDSEEVDVFASLNGTNEEAAIKDSSPPGGTGLNSQPRLAKRNHRRRRDYDPFSAQHQRWYIVALSLLLLAAALIFFFGGQN